ncbi:Acg family FMN-binding oxidoreductase [Cryptosporangium minutisporangium]|uniref:Acg family FMN-binding oxidoreductase n=1 Tax=Cryptosporangium minutisporangium TaxID=113569 RepID=UPI003CD07DF9
MALGAAAYNVRLGYALLGWRAEAESFPEPDEDHLLVRVRPANERPPTPGERELAAAIPRRHTNRRPYLDTAVPTSALTALTRAAEDEAGRLTVLDPRAVGEAMALVREADEELDRRAGYAAEQRAWTRGGTSSEDGVREDRLAGRPHPDERLRRRDFGGGPARRYESDPCLAVLTTTGDSRYDEVRAGQALQHVLLRATASGLTASLYSQPIEVPSTRGRLGTLCGGGTPQMLLRVGYGLAHSPTARRPVPEVLVPDRDD